LNPISSHAIGRVVYPIEEVLLLVTCATIASCDDFENIDEWREHHSIFCGSSPRSTTAFRVRAGCATW
jgi:hypothetical protein